MFKLLKYFIPLLFPSLLCAQDSGLYGALDMGAERGMIYIPEKDKKKIDIKHNYIGTWNGKLGYQLQNGWRFGIDASLSGAGGSNNLRAEPLVSGMDNLPYTTPSGVMLVDIIVGIHAGYPMFHNNSDEIYFYLSLLHQANIHSFIPITPTLEYNAIQLSVDGRAAVASKFSVGFGAGIFWAPTAEAYLIGFDKDNYMRLENADSNNAVTAKLRNGIWEAQGNVKLIYAASKSFDVFVKYDLKARLTSRSKMAQTEIYDVLNNRSLGEVSLHTRKYLSVRNGLYIGILF